MLYYAYGVAGNEISAPPWLAMNKFDIAAKIPPGTTKPQFAVMLQNLLAERVHLVVHHRRQLRHFCDEQGWEIAAEYTGEESGEV